MAKVQVTTSYLSDIAAAIRTQNGGSAKYRPSQMAAAISALPRVGVVAVGSGTTDGGYYSDSACTTALTYDTLLKMVTETGGTIYHKLG